MRNFGSRGRACFAALALGLLFVAGTRTAADDVPAKPDKADRSGDVIALAGKIDAYVQGVWAQGNVQPAPLADDAEYLRRVTLDLIGRTPSVSELRAFLDDPSPTKRRQVVERLLESPGYVNHFAATFRTFMLPADNNMQVQFLAPQFEGWLRRHFRENTPYDKMVRELLLFGNAQAGGRQPVVPNPGGESPGAFFQANENKAENLAASTSRLFLGVQLQCAQCHKHPFARWKQEQFWEYAAIFQPGGRGEIRIPELDKTVQATFLDGKKPEIKPGVSTRASLADWMTAKENPFFAKAAANRLWYHFMGIGMVDPVDDLSDQNPPSHPELLDELAKQFAEHDYDFKFLIRAITATRTYQLTSVTSHESQDELRIFARMAVKGMSPEQLFDSLALATGYRQPTGNPNPNQFVVPGGQGSPRAEFIAKFNNTTDKRTEHHTSILQALALMNGKFLADATSLDRSESLAAVADAPFMDTPEKVETLFLLALSRKPRPEELDRMVKYVESGGPKKDPRRALGDVFWALLNSGEFMLNH